MGNGRSRELIVSFVAADYMILFEIIADAVVISAIRYQWEEAYRNEAGRSVPSGVGARHWNVQICLKVVSFANWPNLKECLT